jgi:pyrimidine operon attenuation protein/uracil phosphoribosyltransferase
MNQQNRILKHSEILLRIERMSMEIGENHCDNGQLVLVGLNDRGYFVAELIRNYLNEIENVHVT